MERQEVFEKLVEIITSGSPNLKVPPGGITEETRFAEDLGADSLDMAELAMSCEDEFGDLKVEDEQSVKTVGHAVTGLMKIVKRHEKTQVLQ